MGAVKARWSWARPVCFSNVCFSNSWEGSKRTRDILPHVGVSVPRKGLELGFRGFVSLLGRNRWISFVHMPGTPSTTEMGSGTLDQGHVSLNLRTALSPWDAN